MSSGDAKSAGDDLPLRGRLLGVDYGTKRVGVAVSDVFQEIVSPLYNYQRVNNQADTQFFQKVVVEYEAAGFVVGLPLHMSGDDSGKSKEARRYAKWLQRITDLPVAFQDERYSSVRAEAMMIQADLNKRQRNARIDKLAAHVLLQDFVESRSSANNATKQPTENDDSEQQL